MVKILVIRSGSIGTEDICNSLKSNGFGIETVAAEYITKAQLRCIACAMIICERKVLENKEIHAFLQNWTAPVLWIVDEKDLPAAVSNFRMGLEDYIVLPTETAEILARVRMLLRCAGMDTGRKLTVGDLYLDADARVAVANGEEVPLTMREFNILFGLLSEPEKAFSRQELMQKYWDEDSKTNQRAVDVYMTKLREKFSDCNDFRIATVHGIGYKAVMPRWLVVKWSDS